MSLHRTMSAHPPVCAARRAPLGFGVACAVAWLLAASGARAELGLQWDAPAGCPSGDEVLDHVRSLAGLLPDSTDGLSASGRIVQVNGHFVLTLLVREGDETRERVIDSDSCTALAGAAGVTLAFLLGAHIEGGEPATQETKEAPEKPPRDEPQEPRARRRPRPPQDAPTTPEPPPAAAWGLVVRAPVVNVDFGLLGRPALGVGLNIGVRHASWALLLGGLAFWDQTLRRSDPNRGEFGAQVHRLSGQLAVCRRWRSGPFGFSPCLGPSLDHLRVQGFGEGVRPRSPTVVVTAIGAGMFAYWHILERLALFGGGTGHLYLSRPRIVIDGLSDVRRFPPVGASGTAGVEWNF